ncbi:inositol monophosphatase family protein [Halobaculum sp. MBLA0147]|uniref:inositol monophosphatase family protein n=1 Tax=Halobaculum sp. MBLA0147 TaxID=3079934 RepID=UPI0035268542
MHARRLTTTDRIVAVVSPDSDRPVRRLERWTTEHGVALTTVPVGESPPGLSRDGEATLGVAVGGDGTFLQAVRQFAPHGIPILGVDTGTLAFLVRVPADGVGAALTEIVLGRAAVERRPRLTVAASDLSTTALNDVVVRPRPPDDPVDRKTVGIDVYVDREYVGEYHGGGVVVSTATGSTGLALSAGGPIHDPRASEAVQIVPLETHSLGVRPLVVGPDTPITVVPDGPTTLRVDGGQRYRELEPGTPLHVDGTAPPAELVTTRLDDQFYDTLEARLGWSVRDDDDPRTDPTPPTTPTRVDADGSTRSVTPVRTDAVDPTRPTETDDPARVSGADPDVPVDLSRALRVAVDAVESVAEPLRRRHGDVDTEHHKTDSADIVTDADRLAEETITATLDAEFPQCACLSEECGATRGDGAATWIVDPLDGTSNYANGNPNYCVSVGLVADGVPVLGVVHAPETGDLWTEIRDRFARLNGDPVSTTDREALSESVLMSGYDPGGAFLREFYDDARGIRRLGSAGLHLCHLASGATDAVWEYDTAPWDVAAGVVVARAAGATLTGLDGEPFEFDAWGRRTPLLGTNGPLHDSLSTRTP